MRDSAGLAVVVRMARFGATREKKENSSNSAKGIQSPQSRHGYV